MQKYYLGKTSALKTTAIQFDHVKIFSSHIQYQLKVWTDQLIARFLFM